MESYDGPITCGAARACHRELDLISLVAGGELLVDGQIYLLDNPLLKEPLRLEHKPRYSATGDHAGAEFRLVHLNRVIKARDLD